MGMLAAMMEAQDSALPQIQRGMLAAVIFDGRPLVSECAGLNDEQGTRMGLG
jgi:hypothetical protein